MGSKPFSLLVVEDNAAARDSICNLIAMRYPQIAIQCAENGQAGLESFAAHASDLVVTDISMPVMDGISMAAEMKRLAPGVAIVALTSYTDTRFLLNAIEIGIDHYLLKPLDCEKLYHVIDKNLVLASELSLRREIEEIQLQSQNELRMASELLEQRVSLRTSELQALVREQESFSYTVSHDLRAPLRHMNNFSAILIEEYGKLLPEAGRDYLERIRSASTRMGALIDHLLELSRVGRAKVKMAPVNLSELAHAIFSSLQEGDPQRQVEVQVEEGLVVMGDAPLLRQLLVNLLGNAWKYTSKRPTAHIQFARTVISGEAAFFVRDDGAGFDMAYKENLFEAFQRLHSTEFEGDGIGLATAQRIVHRHGGEIWAEGAEDQGATFYFTLPAIFPQESPPISPLIP